MKMLIAGTAIVLMLFGWNGSAVAADSCVCEENGYGRGSGRWSCSRTRWKTWVKRNRVAGARNPKRPRFRKGDERQGAVTAARR